MFNNLLSKKVKELCRYAVLTVVVLGMIAGNILPAFAGELDMLINKLEDKGVITYGEGQQIMTESKEEMRKELAAGKLSLIPAWLQNMTISGDLRLRVQDDWVLAAAAKSNNYSGNYDRIRDRVRLRMNVDTRLTEGFKAGFGFATGSEAIGAEADELNGNVTDANSGSANATFNGFGRLPLELNLAFIEYDPSICGFNGVVTVGKMRQGTQVWNATDLLWESSLNPDGVALTISRNINSQMNLALIGSWLTIDNIKSATLANPTASIGELVYTWDTDDYKVKLGVAEQNLDVQNECCGTGLDQQGNAGVPLLMSPAGAFVAANGSLNYNVMSESFELTWKNLYMGNGVSVIGDMASNGYSAANVNIADETASCYGIKLGASSVAGFSQWQIVALARNLGGNAWISGLGSNDPDGGKGYTNIKGSQEQINLGLSKALTVAFTYYQYDKIEGATALTPYNMFQSDLIYKF